MPDAYYIPRQLRVRGGGNFTSDLNLSAGGLDLAVSNATSGTNLVSYGWHYSSATTATFLLADPEVGREVSFSSISGATGTTYTIVVNTTSVLIATSSGGQTGRQVAINGPAGIRLVGLTSGLYASVGQYGNVVYSSST